MLPEAVLRRAADEMLDYQGAGQSVMGMSTAQRFMKASSTPRRAFLSGGHELSPDNYKVVLASQGGASSQFAMVP